ncbi:MAG: hypothetical protein WCT48_03860, partial [Candidatus Paceibacterota bacterium]
AEIGMTTEEITSARTREFFAVWALWGIPFAIAIAVVSSRIIRYIVIVAGGFIAHAVIVSAICGAKFFEWALTMLSLPIIMKRW